MTKYKSHKGATLIEILVALIVVSIGMLGVAGLQVAQLYQVAQASLSYIVSQQVNDIADRIRANPVGAADGKYDSIGTTIVPVSYDCKSAECTPEQLANLDAYQWNTNNSRNLPNGIGTVTSSDSENFNITITWSDKDDKAPTSYTASLKL